MTINNGMTINDSIITDGGAPIGSGGIRLSHETVNELFREMQANAENPERRRAKSGMTGLDTYTGGFTRGGFSLIIGRPGEGKTTFLTNIIAHNLMAGTGSSIAFFSLEMTRDDIFRMIMLAATPEPLNSLNPDEYISDSIIAAGDNPRLRQAHERMREMTGKISLTVYDDSAMDIDCITAEIDRLCEGEAPPDLVLIDYYQAIRPSASMSGADSRNRLVDISTRLRLCASRHRGCAIVLLAQARRDNSGVRTAPMPPVLDAIAECDQPARDAWMVMSICREQLVSIEVNRAGLPLYEYMGCAILKHRNGPRGYHLFGVIPDRFRLFDLPGGYHPDRDACISLAETATRDSAACFRRTAQEAKRKA